MHYRPYAERRNFCLDLAGLPEETPFELYCFYRTFQNNKYEGGNSFKGHRLHESMQSELVYAEMEVSGTKLKYVLLSALSSSHLHRYLLQHHQLDVLPIGQTLGFRQHIVVDYKNLFGVGKNSVILLTQPNDRVFLKVGSSLSDFVCSLGRKMKSDELIYENGALTPFHNIGATS